MCPCSLEMANQREIMLEFQVLGPVCLRVDDQRVELGSDKERILLTALAVDAGRPISMGSLTERLWDEEPPPHARENVHSYVSRLRRRLRLAEPSAPQAARIAGRAHTYTLEVSREAVDWHRFQHLVAQAGAVTSKGDDARTVLFLERAERLWRGEALSGLPGLWAETMRRTMAENRLGATVSRTAALLRLGRFSEASAELSALVDRHPGDETLAGQLMLAYYGNDRYTEALRVHQETRRLLNTQYGSGPGAELNRIHRGILERRPVAELTGGTAPAPSSSPRTPAAYPPRNLPHQLPLIGRRTELRALSAAVDAAPESCAVVSLRSVSAFSGMAGVGKTAVAVHGAHRLAQQFPDAQLYLDLRGHSPVGGPLDPGAALATLLRLLGVAAEAIPVELEGRTSLWRTLLAERRAVIVLDDAVSADQVRPLLPGGSPSLTIITSRRHLTGLPHARHIALDVLPTDDAIALFRTFAGEERTQDTQEVARIVRLCGNLPLAIELVASRFHTHPSWTPSTLTERLARTGRRLGEIRDAEQEVVIRAFDLTYRTLTEQQRTAFRRLSLCPGADITRESAAAALGLTPPAAEMMLESLLACHLLREPTPDRYQYHDLLREYGRDRCRTEDTDAERTEVLRRLTDFYSIAADHADRLAHPHRIQLGPPRDCSPETLPDWPDVEAAVAWLTAERVNLLSVEHQARLDGDTEAAAHLAYSMAGFLIEQCHWSEARTILQAADSHWTRSGDRAALCRVLFHLSAAHTSTACYPQAAETGERALRIAREISDSAAEAESLRTLGALNWHLGKNQAALVLFQKAFAIVAVSGDPLAGARQHNNIAVTLLFLGEHERAAEHFRRSLAGFTEAGDQAAMGKSLNNIGDLYLRTGEPESARHSFEKALALLEHAGNRYDRATVRCSLADAFTELGETDTALPFYRDSLREFRAIGDLRSQADTLIGIGESHRRSGEPEAAVRHLLAALDIARPIGAAYQEARALRRLGEAHLDAGRPTAADECLRAAISVAERTHNADEKAEAIKALTSLQATFNYHC